MSAFAPIAHTPEVIALLTTLGWTRIEHEADWEDIGGPESGPKVVGHNAYTEWQNGNASLYVENGRIEAYEIVPPDFEENYMRYV